MRFGAKELLGIVALCAVPIGAHAQDGEKAITIVVPDAVEVVEPCISARNHVGRVTKHNIFETLTNLDAVDGSLQPSLAESWEMVDEDTWRFTLRQGVKFHDGTDFNAEAAVFGINRTLNPDLAPACLIRTKFFGGMTVTPEAVDDHTLDITVDPPQPILPTMMSHLSLASTNTVPDEYTREPVGTGPYKLESWDPNQNIVLTLFEDYWGETPDIERVTYVWRSETAVQAAMVETGEADLAPYIAVQDATNPETDVSYLNSDTYRVRMTMDLEPFTDIRVRKALNLAIDREAFLGSILGEDVQLASQLVFPRVGGYNSELEVWPYDPEEAKRLLEEARADGVAVDTPIDFINRTAVYPNAADIAAALAQMWEAVGFNLESSSLEAAQWVELAAKPYAADRGPTLLVDTHDNNTGDASATLFFKYHSDGGHSELNNAELDKVIEDAAAKTGEERNQLFAEAFRMIAQDIVPDVPLFHMVGYARVGPRLEYEVTPATNNELDVASMRLKE